MPFSLSPNQKQTIIWVGLWLLLMVLLVLLGPVLTPFIAGAILAYILNPAVERICAWNFGKFQIPRVLAVLLVIFLLFALLVALVLIVVPVVQEELPLLQEQIPNFLTRVGNTFGPVLQQLDIELKLDPASVRKMLTEQFAASKQWLWQAVLSSIRMGGTALLGWLAMLVLIPVVLFYLLLDWRKLLRIFVSAVPRRWTRKTVSMANEVDDLLAQYLRGQFLVMLVLSVYYSSGLAIAGFDIALPVGIITGMLAFVPYVGFGIGLVMALLAGMLQFSDWYGVIAVAIIYGIGQGLEGFFLTPKLVGERIGLHPLMVIFALLAFGQLFGFVGVLLALPSSAILSVAFRHVKTNYVESNFYKS
ncbi:MAG: AI-2E family transporter [Burkholderiaceae bacterium]|nr:AI-2E family transporter [Burkholderiaceae bacterium]